MIKVCVVTGTRAEYGLLKNLIKLLNICDDFKLQLVVTGMHLSKEYGFTYREIISDKFKIDFKVDVNIQGDDEISISKSMGFGMINFAEAYKKLQPDIIVVVGDRYEIFSAVSVAMISNIPIAHIHGGELTLGAFDNSIRHSITKMSHIHFAATEEYKKRIIQLGENPKNVFNVGGLGVDNINSLKILKLNDLEKIET